MKKTRRILSAIVAGALVCAAGASLSGCGDKGNGLIKVGIINNDPNESGYRTANVNDLKNTFTEENGFDAQSRSSLRRSTFRMRLITFFSLLLIPPVGIQYFRMRKPQALRLSCLTVQLMLPRTSMRLPSFPIWQKKARPLWNG